MIVDAMKQRCIAGIPVDYLNARRPKLPERSPEFDDYVDQWIARRQSAIDDVRRRGERAPQGQLNELSMEMIDRWGLLQIGNSPKAWMERSTVFSALMMDFRSRQFGRRVLAKDSDERSWLGAELSCLEQRGEPYKRPTPAEEKQALTSVVFAREYQNYLNQLLIRPPGDPPPANSAFPSFYAEPDSEVKRIIAELAHCRPCGAFFTWYLSDEWMRAGGRKECRKRSICPHCHARHVTRLVERVEAGPWAVARRRGRHLAFVRMAVTSEELNLSLRQQEADREDAGLYGWLRPSPREYESDPGDETMIRNIDCDQDLNNTLTRHEVRKAQEIQQQLIELCASNGLHNGMGFHSVGPRQKYFMHELSVVGEVSEIDIIRFSQAFGIDQRVPEIVFFFIECVVFPRGYAGSARLALAGSSWRYDLDRIGATQNGPSLTRTCWPKFGPVGLRGACAWQPLFLMTGANFWSRWRVFQNMKFKSHQPLGEWRLLLKSDRKHLSAVQMRRKDGRERLTYTPTRRLQRRIKTSGIRQVELAVLAGVSRSAVSRFVKHGYGSPQLQQRLAAALPIIGVRSSTRFCSAKSVKHWLTEISRTQRWLANALDVSPSKVSRLLSGKANWETEFGMQVEALANCLAGEVRCNMFTHGISAQVHAE
ncbi:MAG: helix-turn-helix transcriptional regulator [Planctomycetaceae bacterium]|nr:helix-turn-helix transcriptional regulator [Planctomycetaceae bacterium]